MITGNKITMRFLIKVKGDWLMRLGKYLSSLTKPKLEEIITNANFADEEQKIFELLAKDKCISEIAINLCVCERTINRRIKNIDSKISKVGEYRGKNNT